jgi:hypothetical protein
LTGLVGRNTLPRIPGRPTDSGLQDLVGAATDALIAQGSQRAQMADVAAAIGVAKGTLYLYVESKEALFDLALRYADAVEPVASPVAVSRPRHATCGSRCRPCRAARPRDAGLLGRPSTLGPRAATGRCGPRGGHGGAHALATGLRSEAPTGARGPAAGLVMGFCARCLLPPVSSQREAGETSRGSR